MFNLKEGEREYLSNSGCTTFWVASHSDPSEKMRAVCENNLPQGQNCNLTSPKKGGVSGSSATEPQDADYHVPQLLDEVEDLILARAPRSEYGKFCVVSKRFLSLVKSGELFRIRKGIGFKEPSVFVLSSKETTWWSFDREFKSARQLPILPADPCFDQGDKESLCAGTHLLVLGNEFYGLVVWRYDLVLNQWSKGPSMINSRCMFASANCDNLGYVAGGIGLDTYKGTSTILDSAERYNPESGLWERLPNMHRKRKTCSGCFMDNKFYVIGGITDGGGNLTCGEAFDLETETWELIPNMLENVPVVQAQCPPLVAVVNNQLYYLEASSNKLLAYLKKDKSWKILGGVPVRADSTRGWGVAFKSLGNELLVIGASSNASQSMTVYTCCPDPEATELQWKRLECGLNQLSNFIKNCSVMLA